GADANTGWLNSLVALDPKGFIKTGPDLTPEDLAAAKWSLERPPYLFETALPGVFAVGDVRCGNIKRVASAVGEGSIAISFVHRGLAQQLGHSAISPAARRAVRDPPAFLATTTRVAINVLQSARTRAAASRTEARRAP